VDVLGSDEFQSDKCNLIVNYLPQNIDDAALATLFANEGAVNTAKVVRDKVTKKSLGFGFVKFVKEEDAKEAITAKNGFVIGNKKLKVAYARPSCEEIKNCKIYVTNLPREYDEEAVKEMFKDCGEIIECRVLKDRNSTFNRGVSFIQFANKKQCDVALLKDGTFLDDNEKPLVVKFAEDHKKKKDGKGFKNVKYQYKGQNSPRRAKAMNNEHPGNYFYDGHQVIGGLGGAHIITHTSGQAYTPTTHGLAYGHSMKYGNLNNGASSYVPDWLQPRDQGLLYEHLTMDRYSQHHRTTGTIYMNSPRHGLDKRYSGCICLHVAALPSTVDVALLHDLFAPFGRIVSAHVFVDESGSMYSGRAQVHIEGLEAAHLALQALNGAVLFEGSRPLLVTMTMNP
jgi:RNA recognition motif-containing protein